VPLEGAQRDATEGGVDGARARATKNFTRRTAALEVVLRETLAAHQRLHNLLGSPARCRPLKRCSAATGPRPTRVRGRPVSAVDLLVAHAGVCRDLKAVLKVRVVGEAVVDRFTALEFPQAGHGQTLGEVVGLAVDAGVSVKDFALLRLRARRAMAGEPRAAGPIAEAQWDQAAAALRQALASWRRRSAGKRAPRS
jgi:hypothetical protein